jgi:SNF family Na+-dependent transporter
MDYSIGDYIFIILFIWAALTSVIATIVAVVDILRSDFYDPRDKKKWLYVVVATGVVGAVVYYFVGRRETKKS